MSYTMTMEPEVEREATAYAAYRGFSMEQLLRYCIEKVVKQELERRETCRRRVAEFQQLIEGAPHLEGEPYKFNRADAYEDENEATPADDVELQMRKLSAIAEKYSGRVEQGYKFNRADAYPEGVYA